MQGSVSHQLRRCQPGRLGKAVAYHGCKVACGALPAQNLLKRFRTSRGACASLAFAQSMAIASCLVRNSIAQLRAVCRVRPKADGEAKIRKLEMQKKSILFVIFCVWLFAVLIYGGVDIYNTMNELRLNPSPDLYANNLGFQIIAFALTKGLVSLVVLAVWVVAGFFWPDRTERQN